MTIDLGDAPIGTIDQAAEKAIAIFQLLTLQGWYPDAVSFTFMGTRLMVGYASTVASVHRAYTEARAT